MAAGDEDRGGRSTGNRVVVEKDVEDGNYGAAQ